MIVYHGSNVIVEKPDVNHSLKNLDFGEGFYVTTVKEQAERWAKRKAMFGTEHKGYVSVFEIRDYEGFKVLDFGEDLDTWIDFVCKCRDGSDDFRKFDIIKGKVANDKVFRVVDFYKRGIWDKERAIKEIKVYDTYDQIAFISQDAMDSLLKFQKSYEVEV